jgi:hypothetical protein
MTDQFVTCFRKVSVPSHPVESCFLFGGNFVPPRHDASCSACAGMVWLRERYAQYIADGGTPMAIRAFREKCGGDNAFTERVRWLGRTRNWTSNI